MKKKIFCRRCTTLTCEGILLNSKSKTSKKNEAMCGLCLRKTNVNEILKNKSKIEILFDKSMDYMDALNWAKAVPLLTAYLEKLYKLGSPPCREMFLAQEALRTCYAQTGNVWVLDE